MIAVTENAKVVLKEILSFHSEDPNMGLRVLVDPENQMKMELAEVEPGDQIVEHEGSKVLLLASELAQAFEGFTLNAEDCDEGVKLVVRKD